MRSPDVTQSAIFSYRTLEQRIPQTHPLRKLRAMVDGILGAMHAQFEALLCAFGAPLDCAGAPAAGEPDPDALQHPLGTAVGAAP